MKKILVVDDSPAWRVFHKNNLEEVFIETGTTDYKIDIAEEVVMILLCKTMTALMI